MRGCGLEGGGFSVLAMNRRGGGVDGFGCDLNRR